MRALARPLVICAAFAVAAAGAQENSVAGAMTGVVASMAANHAAAPVDAATRQRVQARISRAESNFQLGLDQYRAANPAQGAVTIQCRDHLRQAKAYFLLAKDDLEQALNVFGDAVEGDDAERRLDAVALREYNQRLLVSVERADAP